MQAGSGGRDLDRLERARKGTLEAFEIARSDRDLQPGAEPDHDATDTPIVARRDRHRPGTRKHRPKSILDVA